jgi:hypothetical protein
MAMNRQPATVTQKTFSARPSALNSRKVYLPAIRARLAMTMMSATIMPQPPIQPACGPMARVTQAKVVPQSGSARFR